MATDTPSGMDFSNIPVISMSKKIDKYANKFVKHLKNTSHFAKFKESFKNSKTDSDRIKHVIDVPYCHELISVTSTFKGKSAEESTKWRTEGNKLFQNKNNSGALECYSKSILSAPLLGEELSLAYANRSAVLFHMKHYELCLKDIDLALSGSYPAHLVYKIKERKGKCYFYRGQLNSAALSFNEALSCLEDSNLDVTKKQNIAVDIGKQLERCKSSPSKPSPSSVGMKNCSHGALPKLSGSTSPIFPCAAEDIGIKMMKGKDRCIVATKDISVGDVIIIEKPYSSVVLPQYNLSHCQHCTNRVVAPIPCDYCQAVVYCSVDCKEKSWKLYHYVECQCLEAVQALNLKLGHLALRMVLKAGWTYLQQQNTMFESFQEGKLRKKSGFNAKGFYDPDDYYSVYCLVNHSSDRVLLDLLRRSMCAIYFIKCIERSTYFSTGSDDQGNSQGSIPAKQKGTNKTISPEDFAYAAGHVLRHLQMLPCNAHEVSELALNPDMFAQSETLEIGSGIYATLSLINHSCDPNVIRQSYGDICVVRAFQNISKGAEIVDNYGALYPLTSRLERQSVIRNQYYFHCCCEACLGDWPKYADIPCDEPVFRCVRCSGPVFLPPKSKPLLTECSSCHQKQDLARVMHALSQADDEYKQALQKVIQGVEMTESVPVLVKYLQLLDEHILRPYRDYNDCQEALKQCYNVQANCHVVKATTD